MTFESTTKGALRVAVGLLFVGAAVYVGWFALHAKPINDHLILYAAAPGLVIGGLVLDFDDVFVKALKTVASLLPSLKFGGGSPPTP